MTGPRQREPSRTAAGVAWLRAAHQLVDDEPRILHDPIAPRLLGERGRQAIADRRAELFTPGALGLRAHVLLRSRFAEDQLASAVASGIRQYVILGAGLDTFSYRQPEWARSADPVLSIFEVDQPASQQVKRDRVAAADIQIPPNLTYAAIDFEREPLLEGLGRTGVDLHRPAFFSWLGVSMYLRREAVDALRAVAAFPSSTQLVFTYAQPRGTGPSIADRAAEVGEPWLSFFEPAELEQLLRSASFSTVSFLDAATAATYFANRTDSLAAPRSVRLVSATV
jgi:methyltransferase (TIGR00027 family)